MFITDLVGIFRAGKRVHKAGTELANPAGWKKGQILFNGVSAFVTSSLLVLNYFFPDLIIPEEIVDAIINFLYFLLILVNWFLIKATTKKDIAAASLPSSIAIEGEHTNEVQ